MTVEELESRERELESELNKRFLADESRHEPVTDGSVDAALYVSATPRMLWILKEPWEELAEGENGGGWSVSKQVAARGVATNRGALPMMAYISYSVFNGFPSYEKMPKAAHNTAMTEALRKIALVNIKKTPGLKKSYPPAIAASFQENRSFLLRQITALEPDIIIGGNTLRHFYPDWELSDEHFDKKKSAWFANHNGRLLIHAKHPAQRGSPGIYVDDIVSIIKEALLLRDR